MSINVSELSVEELQELLNDAKKAEAELTKRKEEDNKVVKLRNQVFSKSVFDDFLKSDEYKQKLKRDDAIELSEYDIADIANRSKMLETLEGGIDFD